MSTSKKNKKKLEKFLNNNNSRDKNKDQENNKLNFNNINKDSGSINNSCEKKKYQYEYSNSKMNHINLDMKNDEEEKNILLGLVKEGLISLDELSENRLKDERNYDINNIKFKDINIGNILQKIIFLNKSLNNTHLEILKLENEHNTFTNAINESKSNSISQDNNSINKEINNNDNTEYNYKINNDIIINNNNKSKEILKKYEDDLKFFTELINSLNNNYEEFK